MSSEVRELLAEAGSSIEGIEVTPYFRQITKAGHGMVRLDRMTRSSNGFGFVNTWQVIVLLPQDIATAERFLEDKVTELVEALAEQLVITSVTPQQLALDTNTVPCVVIEGSREH